VTDEQGADLSLDRSALYYQILGLEPGASPGEVSRAYGERLKQWNPEGLPESSELRQEAEKKLQSVQVAFRRIRATWPESVQQIVEAFEQDDEWSTEPGVLLPTGKRLRLPKLLDLTDKPPRVRKAVSVWTFLCGAALAFLGLAFLTNPGWFGLLAISLVALPVAGAWYVGVKWFMRLGRS
jgi:hypothetical protein